MEPIYLDHNATTPVDPAVVEAMLPYMNEGYGNASSVHLFGRDAKVALEQARETIAGVINCEPSELYFTSGGTESDNIAVLGTAYQYRNKNMHLVGGAAEPLHVVTAMGVPLERGQAAVRFSMGRVTTKEHMDHVVEVLPPIVERLRAMSPTYRQSQA